MATLQAWECDNCGWSVEERQLPPGRTLHEARVVHGDFYCARAGH